MTATSKSLLPSYIWDQLRGNFCSQLTFSTSSIACLMFCKWLDCTWSCANILGWSEESEDNSWAVSGVKDCPLWLDSALVMTDSTPEPPTAPKWGSRQLWQISSFCLIKASPMNQTKRQYCRKFVCMYLYRPKPRGTNKSVPESKVIAPYAVLWICSYNIKAETFLKKQQIMWQSLYLSKCLKTHKYQKKGLSFKIKIYTGNFLRLTPPFPSLQN